jgi:hypothetical protein
MLGVGRDRQHGLGRDLPQRCVVHYNKIDRRMVEMGHVWTASTGQGVLLAFCLRSGASHVSGLFVRRS